jgi:hypothetical protein
MRNVADETKKNETIDHGVKVIETLRDGARREIERAMLTLQRELAVLEHAAVGDEKALLTCARTLRKAWNLLDCQRIEIGGLAGRLEASAALVTQ